VAAVDAEGIAGEEGCDPEVALLGGLARLMPFVDPDALCAAIWNAYDTGFAYQARAAMRTFDVAYRQAQLATHQVGAGH
jgi:pyruvate ferredoxin oxidoreductase gamma subunit